MNRRIYSLSIAAMLAGTALLSALPASAQNYSTYVQNFDGTTQTPTGITSGGPGRATVTAGQSVIINAPRSANYGNISQSAKSTVTVAGATQTVGTTTFTNQAYSGTQAGNVIWQSAATVTKAAPGLEAFTTASSVNQRPTVDLGGTVSFKMYVFSSSGSSVNVNLEVEESTTSYFNADLPTGPSTAITASAPAPTNVLGMRGIDNPENDIWIVGADGTAATGGTTTPGYPAGGKTVTSGSWQTVTFNLATDPHLALLAGPTGFRTSGLGSIYGMEFVPVNPASNEVFSVYIDDFIITAAPAPEPSEWAGMGIGAMALLGLVMRARRRNVGGLTSV